MYIQKYIYHHLSIFLGMMYCNETHEQLDTCLKHSAHRWQVAAGKTLAWSHETLVVCPYA